MSRYSTVTHIWFYNVLVRSYRSCHFIETFVKRVPGYASYHFLRTHNSAHTTTFTKQRTQNNTHKPTHAKQRTQTNAHKPTHTQQRIQNNARKTTHTQQRIQNNAHKTRSFNHWITKVIVESLGLTVVIILVHTGVSN